MFLKKYLKFSFCSNAKFGHSEELMGRGPSSNWTLISIPKSRLTDVQAPSCKVCRTVPLSNLVFNRSLANMFVPVFTPYSITLHGCKGNRKGKQRGRRLAVQSYLRNNPEGRSNQAVKKCHINAHDS